MRRIHSFEIADLYWCPDFIRRSGTEFLATVAQKTRVYRGTAGVLTDVLRDSGEKNILILGAGSGGDIEAISRDLPNGIQITLSDLHPDFSFRSENSAIRYEQNPIDAFQISDRFDGVRVLYSVFHHFDPTAATSLLKRIALSRKPVAIFEVTERSLWGALVALLVPILVLLLTPWVKPFSWSRLFFTYVIPVLPISIFWDGVVSSLRTYTLGELHQMTDDIQHYEWKSGVVYGPRRERVLYFTGVPVATGASPKTQSTGAF